MPRPKREVVMVRCAGSALLAAVEIYNKPTVEHREQTFAILVISAWEILLKARIVQKNGGQMSSIYVKREDRPREFEKTEQGEPITIGIRPVLGRAGIDKNVDRNIRGLLAVRNKAAHLGTLTEEARKRVLEFGTASVQNFIKLSTKWFGESIDPPYLLPVGFLGSAKTAQGTSTQSQRDLLRELNSLADKSAMAPSEFDVVMHISVELNRGFSGGGNIGLTRNPSAPRVRMTDDEALKIFPWSYSELVDECRKRYVEFKQNERFHKSMRTINQDPQCAYERRLDPTKQKGVPKRYYNPTATLAMLDSEYERSRTLSETPSVQTH